MGLTRSKLVGKVCGGEWGEELPLPPLAQPLGLQGGTQNLGATPVMSEAIRFRAQSGSGRDAHSQQLLRQVSAHHDR